MLPFKKNPFETQNRYGGYAAHGYGSDPVARANRMSQNNRAPQNMPQKETDDLERLKMAPKNSLFGEQVQPTMQQPVQMPTPPLNTGVSYPQLIGGGRIEDHLARQAAAKKEQEDLRMTKDLEAFGRLQMASEAQKLQSEMSFIPQMNAIRGGFMRRTASNLGITLPASQSSFSSDNGYTPSWMRSYQTPQFPQSPFVVTQFPRY